LKHDEKFKYEAVHLSLKVCEILFLYEAPFFKLCLLSFNWDWILSKIC